MNQPQNLSGVLLNLKAPRKIEFKKFFLKNEVLPYEIIAKTIYTAISPGTEIGAYTGAPALTSGRAYPRLLGYCNVGQVLNVGKAVRNICPGDRILTLQSHRSLYKIPSKEILTKLPYSLPAKEAALTYLYNIGYVAMITNGSPKPGLGLAVIGLGVLGLGIVEQARLTGIKVTAVSSSKTKLKLAKKLGANVIKFKNDTQNDVADLVIITSNTWKDWKLALRIAKPGGVISVLGFPGRTEGAPTFNPLEPKYFYGKQLTIAASGLLKKTNNNPNEIQQMIKKNCQDIIELIRAKKLHPRNLISGTFRYQDIEKAYSKLITRDQKSVTYLLKW